MTREVAVFAPGRDPWERQPNENLSSYQLFADFVSRPLEEQTITAFADARGISRSRASSLATKWRWIERAAARRASLDAVALKAAEGFNRRSAIELAGVMAMVPAAAEKALRLGVDTLDSYFEDVLDADGNKRKLTGRDAVALMNAAGNLMKGLQAYLETAGELRRTIEVSGTILHGHVAIEGEMSKDEALRFIAGLGDAQEIDPATVAMLERDVLDVEATEVTAGELDP